MLIDGFPKAVRDYLKTFLLWHWHDFYIKQKYPEANRVSVNVDRVYLFVAKKCFLLWLCLQLAIVTKLVQSFLLVNQKQGNVFVKKILLVGIATGVSRIIMVLVLQLDVRTAVVTLLGHNSYSVIEMVLVYVSIQQLVGNVISAKKILSISRKEVVGKIGFLSVILDLSGS